MEGKSRLSEFVKKHAMSLAIGAASVGFVTHINNNVTNIHRRVTNIDRRVTNIDKRVTVVFDTTHKQWDSVAKSIATLQDTLAAVNRKMEESRRLHVSRYDTLRGKIDTLRVKIAATAAATAAASLQKSLDSLQVSVDSLDNEFQAQTKHLTQVGDSLKTTAVKEIQEQIEIIHSVRVFADTETALKRQKYLKTSRFLLFFWKTYKIENFPESKDGEVTTVHIGKPFTVRSNPVAVCDRKGKLRKGKDYAVRPGKSGQTEVVFSHSLIPGQPILVVLKE